MRTEGVQEALLKMKEAPENTQRITKIKEIMQAVSLVRSIIDILFLTFSNYFLYNTE